MAKTFATKQFLVRLRKAITASRKKAKYFDQKRLEALQQFVGRHYSESGSDDRVPFNTIFLSTAVHIPHLVSENPRSVVTTEADHLRPGCWRWERALAHIYKEIELARTLARGVMDAIFGLAIFKTGIEHEGRALLESQVFDVNRPFCGIVSQNDWVCDPNARHWSEATWMGNRFQLPLEFVMDSGLFKNTDKLHKISDPQESVADKGLTQRSEDQEVALWPRVEFYEIYIRREQALLTLATKRSGGDEAAAQREVEWEGPERGPFDPLSFYDVPDNLYPLPPVAVWRDLHDAINDLGRKLIRHAGRQKEILAYEPEAADGADRVRMAADGDVIEVRNLDKLEQFQWGGVHPHESALLIWLLRESSRFAGNVDLMGGLGGAAETLGQTQLLAGNIGTRLEAMDRRIMATARRIQEKMAWYLAYDPLVDIPFKRRIPRTDIELSDRFNPETREGDWLDYNFEIEPYSMRLTTPEQKAQKLIQWWNSLAMPLVELGLQQGYAPNVESFLRLTARYFGIKEIDELMISQRQMPSSLRGTGQEWGRAPLGAGMRRETVHVHNRGSRAGGQADTDATLLNALMSAPEGGQGMGRQPG